MMSNALKPNDKRVDIRMPTSLSKKATKCAKGLKIKFSQFVRDAIEEKIENTVNQKGINR
jgi:predicted DNA-binding protein